MIVLGAACANASYEMIAGYEPGSQVTDHNAIDLDQKAMETALGLGDSDAVYTQAMAIYKEGGNSKSYAYVKLTTPLTAAVDKKAAVTGTDTRGKPVSAMVYEDTAIDMDMIKIQYATSDVQDDYVKCRVGGLVDTMIDGCFQASGSMTIDGTSYDYTYDVNEDNNNGRTIQGFSTGAESKMYRCTNCPYSEYDKYQKWFGDYDYGDKWVTAALTGGRYEFNGKVADFSDYGIVGRKESIKKGTVFLSIYMYVIREFEDAIDDCKLNCAKCNDDAVHAWDEGVAFYSGSLEGLDGAGSGKLLHQLADKRCVNYGTCGVTGDELSGMSMINKELFKLFNQGKPMLLAGGQCDDVNEIVRKIEALMAVPLIQGALRYAYKVDKLNGGEKENAEGAIFAAAVLPRVAACNPQDAMTIWNNMKVEKGSYTTSYATVKTAFENNYECMGITCDHIGGLIDDADNKYYDEAVPCGTKKPHLAGSAGGDSSSSSSFGISSMFGAVLGAAAVVLV